MKTVVNKGTIGSIHKQTTAVEKGVKIKKDEVKEIGLAGGNTGFQSRYRANSLENKLYPISRTFMDMNTPGGNHLDHR